MQLGTFQTRVRTLLRDTDSSNPVYDDTYIENILEGWINVNWMNMARKVPNFYLATQTITGVDDAIDAADEQYELNLDFKSMLMIRRSDTDDRPVLSYKPLSHQDSYRFSTNLYVKDEDAPNLSTEVWSFYDHDAAGDLKNRIRILPAPTSNTFTYEVTYYRKHTATAGGPTDLVDIPDEYITEAIHGVVLEIVERSEYQVPDLVKTTRAVYMRTAEKTDELVRRISKRSVPNVTPWW